MCGSTAPSFYLKFGHNWGFSCNFWTLRSYLGSCLKTFFGAYLCRHWTLILEVQLCLFVFNSATFWASFALFLPFWAIFWSFRAVFGVGVRFKNIFGTYLCSQSTLVLEVQPYLFAFTSAKFGAFFALFGHLGAIFGVEVRFKNVFRTFLHRLATLFWKYSSILLLWNFPVRLASYLVGWVVGRFAFNEDPVVSLNFDLDFRFYLGLVKFL